jgi:septal ring factor EnvC (AmiA/AmiB activator)
MTSTNPPDGSSNHTQFKKYARDLARLYRSERGKKQQLHAFKQQLVKYANELNQTVLELRETHDEPHRAFLDTIHRLMLAAEYEDGDEYHQEGARKALRSEHHGCLSETHR